MDFPHITLPVSLVVMLVASNVLLLTAAIDFGGSDARFTLLTFFISLIVCVIAAVVLFAETVTTNTFFPGAPALAFAILGWIVAVRKCNK